MKEAQKMSKDCQNFLEAMLFSYSWDDSDLEESDYSIYDIDPDFAVKVESFITGFEKYLGDRDIERMDTVRTFGGNCFWSLSGHGVGFWDDNETEYLQSEIEDYAGSKYKFEHIYFYDDGGILKVEGITF